MRRIFPSRRQRSCPRGPPSASPGPASTRRSRTGTTSSPTSARRPRCEGSRGELAYVGRAQEILFRRSDLPPLQGKVALLRGEFGRDGEAADTLLARGAVGVIEVIDDARRYRLFRQTRGESRLYLTDAGVRSSFIPPLPAVLAGPRMTVTLYTPLTGLGSGSWNDAYLNGLAAGLPSPRACPAGGPKSGSRPPPDRRERAMWRASSQAWPDARRAVLVSAHYDHWVSECRTRTVIRSTTGSPTTRRVLRWRWGSEKHSCARGRGTTAEHRAR